MSKIHTALTRIFDEHRLVFWYDEGEELRHELDALDLPGVETIKKFMSGAQREIYDEIGRFSRDHSPNFAYIEGEEPAALNALLETQEPYQGNLVQKAKTALDALKGKVDQLVKDERTSAGKAIDEMATRMQGMDEFGQLDAQQTEQVLAPFGQTKSALEQAVSVPVIRDSLNRFRDTTYQEQLMQVTALAAATKGDRADQGGGGMAKEPPAKYVAATTIRISYPKACLSTEEEVNEYTETLKEEYLKAIKAGKRISL